MMKGDSTAYNYPATHDRVMSLAQFAVDIAQKQRDPDYNGPRLWGFHVTGVDLWDSVCVNCMRIVDLNIAKDGIEAADWNKKVGHQWDWAIRKTRFHQLTGLCRALVKLGVRVFWETHLRLTNYSWGKNEDAASTWRPDWEKASNNFVYQILICERKDILDEDTGDVVKSEYTVTFDKSKTNARLQGQKRTTLVTEAAKTHSGMDYRTLRRNTLILMGVYGVKIQDSLGSRCAETPVLSVRGLHFPPPLNFPPP